MTGCVDSADTGIRSGRCESREVVGGDLGARARVEHVSVARLEHALAPRRASARLASITAGTVSISSSRTMWPISRRITSSNGTMSRSSPVRVHGLLRRVDVDDRPLKGERVLDRRPRPVADHHVRAHPRLDRVHVLLEDEEGLIPVAATELLDELGQTTHGHRMQPQHRAVSGAERARRAARRPTGRSMSEQSPHDGATRTWRSARPRSSGAATATCGEHGVELDAAVLDELLRGQAAPLLRPPDLVDVVRADAQDRVVGVEGVRCGRRCGCCSSSGRDRRSGRGAPIASARAGRGPAASSRSARQSIRAKRIVRAVPDPIMKLRSRGSIDRQAGVGRVRGEVGDVPVVIAEQRLDDGPEVRPVARSLGVEDELAERRVERLELLQRPPLLQEARACSRPATSTPRSSCVAAQDRHARPRRRRAEGCCRPGPA